MIKEKIEENIKTKIIGRNIEYFETIGSTQVEAKKMAEHNVQNGTIVIAENQENGIGTHDRKWYSEAGKNIMFTLIIYPKCRVEKLSTITVDIAKKIVSVIDNLYSFKLEIKTPNDIISDGKKLGGILTQIVTSGDKIRHLLIGIGLNINQEEFKGEIKENATSLILELREYKNLIQKENKRKIKSLIMNNENLKIGEDLNLELDREKIIAEFCNAFESYCKNKEIL